MISDQYELAECSTILDIVSDFVPTAISILGALLREPLRLRTVVICSCTRKTSALFAMGGEISEEK